MEVTQRHETLGRIIDGRAVAHKLRAGFRRRIDALQSAHGVVPGLAVILVGDSPASALYVRIRSVPAARQVCGPSNIVYLRLSIPWRS